MSAPRAEKAAKRPGWEMTHGARRAVAVLTLLTFALAGASLLWTARQVNADNRNWHQAVASDDRHWRQVLAAQRRQAAAGQAAARKQAEMVEEKLCTSLGKLASRTPPAGSAAADPSRAYLDWQHAVLAELGPDIGCISRRKP